MPVVFFARTDYNRAFVGGAPPCPSLHRRFTSMKRLMILLAAVFCCAPFAWAETPAAVDDPVLVAWRDLTLTKSDYEAVLQGLPERDRFTFQLDMRRITDFLNNMVLTRTLAAEGRGRSWLTTT